MKRIVGSILLTLTMAGCAVGPNYERPAIRASAAGPFVSSAPATSPEAPVPADWWRLYDDPVLDGLIERALVANTDLRVAAANLGRARAALGEARAARLPATQSSGGASYGDATTSSYTPGEDQWTYTAGLSVSWEVDLFGRVTRTIQAARADAQAVEAARDRVRVTVVANTVRSYGDACNLAESLAVARESLASAEASLKLVTAQQQAGSAGRLDVERAATLAETTRAAIPPLESQRRAALFELAALIGATPSEVPPEAAACSRVPAVRRAIPIGDGAALLRRRPDVREAERMLAADTARIGIATADLFPRVTLGGAANFLRNDQIGGNDSFTFSVGPLVSWSFPNIAATRARLRQARFQGDASLAAFDGVVLTALKEVEQALSAYAAAQQRDAALADARRRADNAYRLADIRYRAGSVSYLDLLVAQRELLDSRAALASSGQALAEARVDVFKALGGGWEEAQATK
ncbi:efflux transporter outer membrane subunit [Flavisphingomonas formosensis]|uniref:efflux transporter outer membrane subunit n=1 Tax=Flavisphingomonas formosensis TaxID=861534 RepID=UPI0012F929C3|nr:TolC family protein [Sphingomonas formosensis]